MEKVAICVPTNPYGPTAPWLSFIALKDYMNDFNSCDARFFSVSAQPVDTCRNMIVHEAVKQFEGHPDWYLWIDSDQEILFNVFERLRKTDKDIVSALIPKRSSPYSFCASFKGHRKKGNVRIGIGSVNYFSFKNGKELMDRIRVGELMEVDSVGFGCVLIRGKVFESLAKPYFKLSMGKQGQVRYGEDVNFCRKAREKGYKVWLDCSTNVGHYGPIFPGSTFAAYDNLMSKLNVIPLDKHDFTLMVDKDEKKGN